MEYSAEQLNFFRLCHIVFDIVPEGLREIFKKEWDALYTAAHGQWDDTPASYNCFYNLESPGNRARNKRLLGLMSSGDRTKWDCTCLFYAILFSDSMGPNIGAVVNTSVDDLREIRNEVAHNKDGKLKDMEFKMSIQKIKVALSALKLNITKIKEIEKRADFITQEQINKIKKQSEEIKKELEEEKQRNLEPKSFCVLPPQPSHDTIERTKEVGELYETMQQLSSEKKGETTSVYLSGNPGSGKSVMARQVGQKWYDSDDSKETLRFVVTLNGSTLDTLLNSYVMFAERLNCYQDCITNISTSKDLSKEDKIIQLKALASKQVTKYKSWLIIVDNVVDLKSFSEYWLQSGEKTDGKGQILVTTQDSPSIGASSYCRHISLSSGMSEEDAVEILYKVSGYPNEDKNMMLEVSRALDLQPLALSCIAVYMQSVRTVDKQYTWNQCLAQLEKELEKLETVYKRTSLTYGLPMTAAVNLSLQREMNEEIMLHAFHFLSVISPDPIPLMYVIEYVVKCMADEDRHLVALRVCSSSLVLSLTQGKQEISIHQVVYRCLQKHPKITEHKVNMFTVISAFLLLPEITENKLVDNLNATRPLLNHLVKIAKEMIDFAMKDIKSENKLDDETMILLENCSRVLYIHNMFESEKHILQVILALQLSNSLSTNVGETLTALKDDDHIKYISSINHNRIHASLCTAFVNLGSVYRNLSQFKESIEYYEKALTITKAAYGQNHLLVASILNNLGNVYQDLGRLQESIEYYRKALSIKTVAYGENYPLLCDTLNNLGTSYQKLVQLQKSLEYYEKTLSIRTATYGENHPLVGNTLNLLGNVYEDLGQLQKSIEFYEKALNIKSAAYGESHPSVADILNNLGNVFQELGQVQESLEYYNKALAIFTATGENRPSIGHVLNNLGNVYQELGQLQESIEYYGKALTIYTAAYGEDHPSVGDILNNLGNAYQKLGQLQESIEYYNKALTIYTAAYGENHPSVGDTLSNLGSVYQTQGQLQKSMEYYKNTLSIKTAAYGEKHPRVGDTLNNLGSVYQDLGQLQESIEHCEKALIIKTAAYGENHPSVGKILNNLGAIYQKLGQSQKLITIQESIEYYHKALTIHTAAYDTNHRSKRCLSNIYKVIGHGQSNLYLPHISDRSFFNDH